ncbi:MAG: GNAT family N-acetyltransferase [Rhodothermaceae bacterium]
MTVSLKQATSGEAELMKSLSVQAFTSDFEKYGSFPPGIESFEWHKNEIEKGHYYKIIDDTKVAGGICVIPSLNDEIEIKYLFISDSFQNKGIGSEVMCLIEKMYTAFKIWNLVTPGEAYRNHHFYEKLGYRKVGEFLPDPEKPFKLFEYRKAMEN